MPYAVLLLFSVEISIAFANRRKSAPVRIGVGLIGVAIIIYFLK